MTTICLVSWKGGTGKTTISCNLAERATAAGLPTTLCDFDPQATALQHCQLRATASPDALPIQAMKASLNTESITAFQAQTAAGSDRLWICDMPGSDSFTFDQALSAMDLLLIPTSATPYEIIVTANLVRRGIQKNWTMALLPNNLPAGKKRRQALTTTLAGAGVEIVPIGLSRRVTYWDAALFGLGVCEHSPRSPAAAEMQNLWEWLAQRINIIATGESTSSPQEMAHV